MRKVRLDCDASVGESNEMTSKSCSTHLIVNLINTIKEFFFISKKKKNFVVQHTHTHTQIVRISGKKW